MPSFGMMTICAISTAGRPKISWLVGLTTNPLFVVPLLLLGTAVSAVSAFIVVKWLIRFVQSHTFNGFALYRVLLGTALLAYAAGL